MKFVDSVRLRVKGGDGGNGSIAFRREKYVPFGGPAGGDGGGGGSVVFVADEGRTSLLDLASAHFIRAKNGEHGRGKDQYGKAAPDYEVKVPIGTIVFDETTGDRICDLTEHGARAIVAPGGKGGRGNIHFATSFDRAPRRAEPGGEGEDRLIRLELKVLADVGLLGFPNVGKSTLVATMSRARPKIADYPFTTLRPHLGVVKIGGASSSASFVIADIPGLIPGASEGHGLGTRFLKHVERCRALLHLVAPPTDELREEGRDPIADFDAINRELIQFAPELATRPQIVVMSKADLPETRAAYEDVQRAFAKRRVQLRLISAATGEGLEELARELYHLVRGRTPEMDDAEAEIPKTFVVSTPTTAGGRPAKAHAAEKPAPRRAEAEVPALTKPAAKKVATKHSATKKPVAKKPVAKKPATKKAAAKKVGAKKTATKRKAAVSRKAPKRPAPKKTTAKKAARRTGKAAKNGLRRR